jgi:chromosome segregation ATPase
MAEDGGAETAADRTVEGASVEQDAEGDIGEQRPDNAADGDQAAVQNGGQSPSASAPTLDDLLKKSQEELANELLAALAKITDLEAYTSELDGVADSLQRQLEERKETDGTDPDERLAQKDKIIVSLQAEIDRMERELDGMESGDMDPGINYDALDKLDEELAKAKEMCLLKDAEIANLKAKEEALRRDADSVEHWREAAVQAQAEHRALQIDYETKVKSSRQIPQMRR